MEQKVYEKKSRAAPRHETSLEQEASLDEVAEIYAYGVKEPQQVESAPTSYILVKTTQSRIGKRMNERNYGGAQ
ncbi:MAG: hypothetical protein Q9161_003120 [Pseudevernia consocians]